MNERFCQSCGMPLDSEAVVSMDADGNMADYCIYCYKNGEFTEDVSMEEMIDISLRHMKDLHGGDPGFDEQDALNKMRSFFPELARWKKN